VESKPDREEQMTSPSVVNRMEQLNASMWQSTWRVQKEDEIEYNYGTVISQTRCLKSTVNKRNLQ